jgi:hypothetical protein
MKGPAEERLINRLALRSCSQIHRTTEDGSVDARTDEDRTPEAFPPSHAPLNPCIALISDQARSSLVFNIV